MMEAAGFQVEQGPDSLTGSRKETESDKGKEREIESSKSTTQNGGESSRLLSLKQSHSYLKLLILH